MWPPGVRKTRSALLGDFFQLFTSRRISFSSTPRLIRKNTSASTTSEKVARTGLALRVGSTTSMPVSARRTRSVRSSLRQPCRIPSPSAGSVSPARRASLPSTHA